MNGNRKSPKCLARLSGKTRDGRYLRTKRAEFTAHVGGSPSAVQRTLIERAAWLSLYLARMDTKLSEGRDLTDHDQRNYLAWSNTLARTVMRLGTVARTQQPPSLAQHRAARAGAAA